MVNGIECNLKPRFFFCAEHYVMMVVVVVAAAPYPGFE